MITKANKIHTSDSAFSELMEEALSFVVRINSKLGSHRNLVKNNPQLRYGRQVLSDGRCLYLAGLINYEDIDNY